MARALRIEYEGAWYHVMNRGAARSPIFYGDIFKKIFLNLLDECHAHFQIEVHGYCIMDNHYHLFLHTPLANLGKAMHRLDGMYAKRYNFEKQSDGPIFKSRYKANLIDNESYFLHLSRYIHLNPVKAKIVKCAEQYQWSSYNAYLGNAPSPKWLYCHELLGRFPTNRRHQNYRIFVEEGIKKRTPLLVDW